ncbi:MAG: hypothetical protein HYR85_22320 [Planctomycetes bacterium]|nr:hypothetical protein [Planctomycetota bacterium]MBI3844580.1 hypothetical protein [Planctomycetota bacterium]
MNRMWNRAVVAATVAVTVSFGCSRHAPTNTEEALRARVSSFWDLKIKRDVGKMYDYFDQSYRDKTSLADYIGSVNRDMKYFEFKIDSIERDGDKATVKVSYTYQLPDYVMGSLKPKPRLMPSVPEIWKLENDVWNRAYEETSSAVARTSQTPPPRAASDKGPAAVPAKASHPDGGDGGH